MKPQSQPQTPPELLPDDSVDFRALRQNRLREAQRTAPLQLVPPPQTPAEPLAPDALADAPDANDPFASRARARPDFCYEFGADAVARRVETVRSAGQKQAQNRARALSLGSAGRGVAADGGFGAARLFGFDRDRARPTRRRPQLLFVATDRLRHRRPFVDAGRLARGARTPARIGVGALRVRPAGAVGDQVLALRLRNGQRRTLGQTGAADLPVFRIGQNRRHRRDGRFLEPRRPNVAAFDETVARHRCFGRRAVRADFYSAAPVGGVGFGIAAAVHRVFRGRAAPAFHQDIAARAYIGGAGGRVVQNARGCRAWRPTNKTASPPSSAATPPGTRAATTTNRCKANAPSCAAA